MTASAHTQGRWYAAQSFDQWAIYAERPAGAGRVQRLAYLGFDSELAGEGEMAANARLMGAAPDLLAACIKAQDWLTPHGPHSAVNVALRAAIAKATGVEP